MKWRNRIGWTALVILAVLLVGVSDRDVTAGRFSAPLVAPPALIVWGISRRLKRRKT